MGQNKIGKKNVSHTSKLNFIMKEGIKFIVSYSILTICLFAVSKLFFTTLTAELFSYLLFYYIVSLSISVLLFPIFCTVIMVRVHNRFAKFILSLILCLIILNVLPFIYDNRIILFDALIGVFEPSKIAFNTLGVHVIAITSFIICYLLYKNDRIWQS